MEYNYPNNVIHEIGTVITGLSYQTIVPIWYLYLTEITPS